MKTIILSIFLILICSQFTGCKEDTIAPILVDESPQVSVNVYIDPIPFKWDSKYILAYELHIVNNKMDTLAITQIKVLPNNEAAPYFPPFEGDVLAEMMSMATPPNYATGQTIFFWLEFEGREEIPTQIMHQITYIDPVNNENIIIESEVLNVANSEAIQISSPVKGNNWLALNGPSNKDHHHRRFAIDINGTPYMGQRHAVDWLRIGENGLIFKNRADPGNLQNDDFHCYGDTLYAVADGYIIDSRDGMPENPVGSLIPGITLENAGGNFIILCLNETAYAFYAHLIPGSLLVQTGDYVYEGQAIGLLGNSGNSDLPHLHFHLATGNSFFYAQGIPYEIKSFSKSGALEDAFEWFDSFQPWQPQGQSENVTSELPVLNTILNF